MNRRTFRVLVAGALALVISGCQQATPLFQSGGVASGQRKSPDMVQNIAIAGGDLSLSAPGGYCIDPKHTRTSARQGVVLLSRCDMLGHAGAPRYNPPALLVVTYGAADDSLTAPTPALLEKTAAPAKKVRTAGSKPALALFEDSAPPRPGLSKRFWRGAVVQNDRLLTVSLYAPQDSAALGSEGAELVSETMRQIRAPREQASLWLNIDTTQSLSALPS